MSAVVALAATLPSVASASSGGDLLGGVDQGINNTLASVTETATEQLCAVATNVNAGLSGLPLLGGLLGPVASPINSIICELGLFQLDFRTVYRAPDGHEIVRDTFAVPEVPSLIDLTGDGIPDAIGVVSLSSFNQITLNVDKLLTAPARLPAQVELILRNPSNVQSSSRIAVGFDARDFNMPHQFGATLSLLSFSPLHLGVSVTQQGDPAGIALIASMFNLQPDGTRVINEQGRVQYVAAPASMGYDLTSGSGHQHVSVASSTRSKVTAAFDLINGSDEQTINGTIDQIPSSANVDISTPDETHRTVAYKASQSVGDMALTYDDVTHSLAGDVLNTEVTGHVVNLPTGLTVQQTGARTGTLTTAGGSIGLVDAGFATGEHVIPMPGSSSGANVVTGNNRSSIAARLSDVQAATVEASGPYAADIQAATQAFHMIVQDQDAQRTIDALVNDLPAHIALTYDPDHGKVTENGFGQGISNILVDAKAAKPFFAAASHLHANLQGIPASFNLQFKQNGTDFSASIDNPVKEIDFSADDGAHSVSSPGSDSGLTYDDVPGDYALAGRIFGLKSISFQSDPIKAAVSTAGGHVFNLAANVIFGGANTTATGMIDQLPANVSVALASANSATTVTYGASSSISHLTLDASRGLPFFALARHIHADLTGIPAAFNLTFTQNAGAFSASIDNPVNEIQFAADDGTNRVSVPGSDSGLAYHDVPGVYAVAGRVFGLRSVSFAPDQPSASIQSAPGHVFNLDGLVELNGQPVTASGVIDQVPSDVSVTTTHQNGGTAIDYIASSRIDRIEMQAEGPQFVGRAHFLYAKVLGLPRVLHANLPGGTKLFTFDAGGDSIDKVEFQALDSARPLVQFPQSGGGVSPDADGVVYHDLTNPDNSPGEYTLAAQLSGLRSASLDKNGNQLSPTLDIDPTKAQVFNFDVQTGTSNSPTYYKGYVNKPAPNMSMVVFFGSSDTINYTADAPISDIVLYSNVSLPEFQFHLRHVPTQLDLCLGTGNDGARPCVRKRLNGYPTDSGDNRDGDHIVAVNVDDHGSSPDAAPMSVDAYVCFTPGDNNDCSTGAAKKYLVIDNLQIHNVMVDLFAQTCAGALFCGHIGIDTRGRPFSGGVTYYDSTVSSWLNSIAYSATFPAGFSADYRYTSWSSQPIGSGGDDNVDDLLGIHFDQFGSVNCPDGTDLSANVELLGGAHATWNIAPEYLCS